MGRKIAGKIKRSVKSFLAKSRYCHLLLNIALHDKAFFARLMYIFSKLYDTYRKFAHSAALIDLHIIPMAPVDGSVSGANIA
mgnify:CR=1